MITKLENDDLEGFGSDLIREGACSFIQSISESNVFQLIPEKERSIVIEKIWYIIDTTLSRSEELLLNSASGSLESYLVSSNGCVCMSRERLATYLANIKFNKDAHFKRGFSLALASMTREFLAENLEEIIDGLVDATLIQVLFIVPL